VIQWWWPWAPLFGKMRQGVLAEPDGTYSKVGTLESGVLGSGSEDLKRLEYYGTREAQRAG